MKFLMAALAVFATTGTLIFIARVTFLMLAEMRRWELLHKANEDMRERADARELTARHKTPRELADATNPSEKNPIARRFNP